MKRNNFKALVICLVAQASFAQAAFAQSADWPPEDIQPAPIMQGLSLAEGRFVPSTSRWNLVWADQIIPYRYSAAQLAFAARHYVGSQKLWADQAAQFRAIDANFLMLIYHLAAGINPAKNSDCPDPKSLGDDGYIGVVAPEGYVSEWSTHFLPWLSAKGIATTGARFEDLFQHYDAVDSSTRVWHQDPYWLMNLDNADWRGYVGDACLGWMQGNEDEGCFFDVAVETSSALYNPKAQNPAPGNFDWWATPHYPAQTPAGIADWRAFGNWMNAQYLAYFQDIYRRFHGGTRDYLVIPNVDQMVTTVYDPVWLDGDAQGETVDGVMMEGFGNYNGYDMWLTLERCVRHVTGRGKILIAQFSTGDATDRLRRAGMYMLVKNANSFINVVSGEVTWYPEYEVDLGEMSPVPGDLEELRVSGSGAEGLWQREYENGMVLVNTAGNMASFDLPSTKVWRRYDPQGGGAVAENGTPAPQEQRWSAPVTRVEVPASDAVILRKDADTDVAEIRPAPERPRLLSCAPMPVPTRGATVEMEISSEMVGKWSLELRDILGRLVRRQILSLSHPGIQAIRLQGGHPQGCYLLRLVHSKGASATMRVLFR
ncbi:MAG: hypothetical protein IH600_12360 [Bacteroidetes bacterium]|nr:hypothetical protein [Bacteroidota bacterium]